MSRILAIEPDPERGRTLKRLVHERVRADFVVVRSKDAAIAAIAQQVPDLMLAPVLLSPRDEAELTSYLRRLHDAPHLQVLTIPPLAEAPETPTRSKGVFAFFRRRRPQLRPVWDSSVVGAQIVDYLEQARTLQAERQFYGLEHNTLSPPVEAISELQTPTGNSRDEGNGDLLGAARILEPQALGGKLTDERRRDHRRMREEVPWLSTVKLPWGVEVCLLNISNSGMLVETTSKLMPGSATEFQLSGPDTSLVVPARYVRSRVAGVDVRCVKYHIAVAFATQLDLSGLRPGRPGASSTPKALADLLAQVLDDLGSGPEPVALRTKFEQGLRKLVPARDIQIRDVPAGPRDGTESIYFTVPSGLGSRVILQATFEPDYNLAESEFRLLRAAAVLAAVVLEFDRTV
jgi:CheY-like chemotaxis protein